MGLEPYFSLRFFVYGFLIAAPSFPLKKVVTKSWHSAGGMRFCECFKFIEDVNNTQVWGSGNLAIGKKNLSESIGGFIADQRKS